MPTCVWLGSDGKWHRSLMHMWRRRLFNKVCARCGRSVTRVF